MKKKILFSFFLLIVYGCVGYFSFGFDDEFANIRWIEKYGIHVVSFIQTIDLHPPGSYFLDWLLFSIFGKWELVRVAISLLTASSLIYAILSVYKRNGKFAAIVLFVLLGLNPAILFWCTSLRWYAYFVPVLVWLSIVPEKQGWRYWSKCFGGILVLGYIGYAVFIVAIPVLLLYLSESKETNKLKIKNIVIFGFLFVLLYSYQFIVFITVHIQNKNEQVSTILNSLSGFYTSQLSNQGVFPLSISGILTSIATVGICISIIYSNVRTNLKNKFFVSYSFVSILSIITGIAGKFRNLVIISPWQAFWIATAKIEKTQKKLFISFFFLLTIGYLIGDFNILTHQNTTKSNWNIPVRQVLGDLNIEKIKCKSDLVVLCSDEMLTWQLERAGYTVIGIYVQKQLSMQVINSKHNCVALLKTWAGKIGDGQYKNMYEEIKSLNYSNSINSKYGRDKFYTIKRKLDPRYPEYLVEITKYYNVKNLTGLNSWQPTEYKKYQY